MSLFGHFPFWTSTCFPEVICPRYNPALSGSNNKSFSKLQDTFSKFSKFVFFFFWIKSYFENTFHELHLNTFELLVLKRCFSVLITLYFPECIWVLCYNFSWYYIELFTEYVIVFVLLILWSHIGFLKSRHTGFIILNKSTANKIEVTMLVGKTRYITFVNLNI